MKKSAFFAITAAVLLLMLGGILHYQAFVVNEESDVSHERTEQGQENEYEIPSSERIAEIPVESVNGITQQEAEQLCYSVMGEKDENTGNIFSFGTAGAVEAEGNQYYVIRASWLVNNDHLSYIGDFFVRSDGNVIYDGVVQPGGYTMANAIWSKE